MGEMLNILKLIAIAVLILLLIWLGLLLFVRYIPFPIPNRPTVNKICQHNLYLVSRSLVLYSAEFDGKYPEKEKWCDLLIQFGEASEEMFICPNDKIGPSSYAMNRYVTPDSPNDVVLLFESKPGWNQYGGPELLTVKNHKGEGANIFFITTEGFMKIEFVHKEDFNDLNWGEETEKTNIE